jgi:peptide/nickel transport system substrate-binding protein
MRLRTLALLGAFVGALGAANADEPKHGGILRVYHRDSPASMSIHEEATWSTIAPMSAVFNNLVIYDQHIKQNSLETIRPELAESWSWSEDGRDLTFKLRHGVKWHDGKPFTAADVKCTWCLISTASNTRSFPTARPRCSALSPASST